MCQLQLGIMEPITRRNESTHTRRSSEAIINPMHIITLKAQKHSFGVRLAARIRALSEQWFSHLLLLSFLCGYALFGALIFYAIESSSVPAQFNLDTTRHDFMEKLWNITANVSSKNEWLEEIKKELQVYEKSIHPMCTEDVKWTVWSSLFYCGTVLTTIGYGNIAPSTDAGRAATIVYAFLGIPLMLMVLADLGKLFTKAIKFVFRYFRRFYKTGTFNKRKAAAKLYADKPLQYMTVSWRTVSADRPPGQVSNKADGAASQDNSFNQVTSLTLHNDELYKDLDFANDEANHKHVEVEDEFNLPVTLAIAMVLIYMVVGAFLFAVWEEWSFFEAFYFVFISMSTVGFGDYVPKHQAYMMGAFAYLVLGLTLTSMCINVIQEKLSATFQKAKVRIGNTIGLDVNSLLRDDQRRTKTHKREDGYDLRKNLDSKYSVPRDNFSGTPSRPGTPLSALDFSGGSMSSKAADNPTITTALGREIPITIPLQNRFKFYDSPYSTIHNEAINNTSSGSIT